MTKKEKNIKKTKTKRKNKKQHLLLYKFISFIFIILSVVTMGYVIYEEILSIGMLIPVVLVSIVIIYVITFLLNKVKLRAWIKNIASFFAIIIMIFEILMLIFGTTTLKFLSNITDTGYRVETFGVYVLDSSYYNKLEDLKDKNINYLNAEDDKKIREVLSKIEKKVKIEYDYIDGVDTLITTLIKGETDAILMETSYEDILMEEMPEKFSKLRLIESFDVVDVVDTIKSDVDITKDPFAIYISGIDTSGNVGSKARSDVNIVMAINPKTHNILMVSTPRDYYVNLTSKNKKDKLTHAGLYGVEESLKSLADLYDVDIDYYARINFTSFVKIVDALGGVSVNVEGKFCEQNSKRSKADGDLICLNKGTQTLNGEQALAYARNRHAFNGGDRARGQHQMEILKAIINKSLSPKIVTKYSSLIDALQGRVTTNMSTNEMYKFAKKQINNDQVWKFTTLSAEGKDSKGVCYATGSGKAYVMEPDMDSVKKIQKTLDRLFDGEGNIEVPEEVETTTTVKTTTKSNKVNQN